MTSALWAITTYFNPARYQRRRSNFSVFRAALNVPLVAIELAFDGEFELTHADAEILLRREGRDVLWQKERLLNTALRELPAECRYVAWVDADVVFDRRDWAEESQRSLCAAPLVQPFSCLRHLPRDVAPLPDTTLPSLFDQPSLASLVASGQSPEDFMAAVIERRPGACTAGMAWVARRELLDAHGFYDACVIGGGDTALACAALGRFDDVIRLHHMNPRQQSYYLAWAEPFHHSVRARVSCVEGDLLHLWHGAMEDRRSRARHVDLSPHDFDPQLDVVVNAAGCWAWNTDKPHLHRYLADYFVGRNEDGRSP